MLGGNYMPRKLKITTTSNEPNIELLVKAMKRFIMKSEETDKNENDSGEK